MPSGRAARLSEAVRGRQRDLAKQLAADQAPIAPLHRKAGRLQRGGR